MHYLTVFAVFVSVAYASSSPIAEGPSFSESHVSSQRSGDNFAYTITDHQGHLASGVRPNYFQKSLAPGVVSAYPAGAYIPHGVAPVAGVAPMSAAGQYYGAVHHPMAAQGISAYSAQPIAYPGQPLVFGHQAVIPQHHVPVHQVHQMKV